MRWWPRRREEPRASLPTDPFSVAWLAMRGIGSSLDSEVTATTAMAVSAVFRAVSLISGTLGTLPLRTLQTKRDGTQERATSFLDNPGLDVRTPFEWKELAAVCLLLHGNAYCQHIYNRNGALIGLNLLQPTAVAVELDVDRPGGRKYCVTLDDGQSVDLDATTLTHIPGLSLDGLQGVPPIALARLGIQAARAGERAAHQSFTSGAMVAGLVTPEDEDLDPDEAKVVKETVNAAMTGPENAGAIAVINRRLKFQPWMLSAVDAQFLQSRTFQIEEIGRWFGVPPHLLGQTEKSTSWGTGIEEQNRGLARYTLQPWTTRIEQRLSPLVAGNRKAEFDYAQLLAPSPDDEIRLLLEQLNGGLMTPNEVRRVRNLPPLPGGQNDELRLPAGAGAPAAPEAAPGDERPAARVVPPVKALEVSADWNEDDHPRDPDGKFAERGGSGGSDYDDGPYSPDRFRQDEQGEDEDASGADPLDFAQRDPIAYGDGDEGAFLDRFSEVDRPVDHGQSAHTRIRTDPATGERMIYKRTDEWDADQAEAEVLGALIGEAMGAPVPKVWRLSDTAVAMEFVEGKTAGRWLTEHGLYEADDAPWFRSREADRLAVMDYIAGNRDRNTGNAMLTPEGQLVGIDHGAILVNPVFATQGVAPDSDDNMTWGMFGKRPWERPGVDLQMLDEIEPKLAALKADFERSGGHGAARHAELMRRTALLREWLETSY